MSGDESLKLGSKVLGLSDNYFNLIVELLTLAFPSRTAVAKNASMTLWRDVFQSLLPRGS